MFTSDIDWVIHATSDVYKRNKLIKNMVNFHTHGLEKHGCTNLSVVTLLDVYPAEKVAVMINTVGRLMVNGDKFDVDRIHNILDNDGNLKFRFWLIKAKCFGEDTLRMILPDRNGKFFSKDMVEDEDLDPVEFELQHTPLFEYEENRPIKNKRFKRYLKR